MGGKEQEYVQQAFDGNWIAPIGPNLNEFEREICNYTGAKYSVGLTSGTAAIHLALKILGVGPGDFVSIETIYAHLPECTRLLFANSRTNRFCRIFHNGDSIVTR